MNYYVFFRLGILKQPTSDFNSHFFINGNDDMQRSETKMRITDCYRPIDYSCHGVDRANEPLAISP